MDTLDVKVDEFLQYEVQLEALKTKLGSMPAFPDTPDTSLTVMKAGDIYTELLNVSAALIHLIEATEKDIQKTKSRYVLANR